MTWGLGRCKDVSRISSGEFLIKIDLPLIISFIHYPSKGRKSYLSRGATRFVGLLEITAIKSLKPHQIL